jgi:hypothetical protein
MNNVTTLFPDLVFEILRYDADQRVPHDTYRFFYLEPHAVDTTRSNYKPFAKGKHPFVEGYEPGPNYCESERHQVSEAYARLMRYGLEKDGYVPMSYESVPTELAHFAAHSQAPIEFHKGLDSYNPKVTRRVVVWVRGELPA